MFESFVLAGRFWRSKVSLKFLICSVVLTIGSGIFTLCTYVVNLPVMGLFVMKFGLVAGVSGTIAVWSCRRSLGEKRTDVLLVNFFVLISTLIILSVSCEAGVRFIFRDITTTADNTSYFAMRWNNSRVRYNIWGFREREITLGKSNKYRIAIIGDSFTYGQGIEEKERFSNLLEKWLNNKESNRYEVLNFGKPGAESDSHVTILQNIVLKMNPNFILLQWYINDFESRDKSRRPKMIPLLPSSTLHHLLHKSSALYYLINQQWNILQTTLDLVPSYSEYMFEQFGDPKSPPSRQAVRALKNFVRLCKNQKISLGIVLFPHLMLLGSNDVYPYNYLHERVLRLCDQEKITCTDLRSTLAPYMGGVNLWVNRFDAHPGSLANRLAAEHIMETFGESWLSEPLGRKMNGDIH